MLRATQCTRPQATPIQERRHSRPKGGQQTQVQIPISIVRGRGEQQSLPDFPHPALLPSRKEKNRTAGAGNMNAGDRMSPSAWILYMIVYYYPITLILTAHGSQLNASILPKLQCISIVLRRTQPYSSNVVSLRFAGKLACFAPIDTLPT